MHYISQFTPLVRKLDIQKDGALNKFTCSISLIAKPTCIN